MATESSAIARFVNLAQSTAIHDPDAAPIELTEPVPPLQAPVPAPAPTFAQQPPVAQQPPAPTNRSSWWLALIGTMVIGGSVSGGYILAQQQTGGEGSEQAELGSQAALAAEDDEESRVAAAGVIDAEESEAPAPEPETALAPTAVESEPEEEIGPDTEEEADAPEAAQVDIELAKNTGFDVLVEQQGANVSLDGHPIGVAPLRVRNLLPGAHAIDIEGPKGYFGKHLEFDLRPGKAEVLKISLDALGGSAAPVGAPVVEAAVPDAQEDAQEEAEETKTPKRSRRQRRKARREARRAARRAKRKSRSRKASAADTKILEGAAEVGMGTLMLGAKPPCEIIINGKKTGLTTPQRAMQLPDGIHRVVLINREHDIRKRFKVKIKAGRTTRAIQDLTKKLK